MIELGSQLKQEGLYLDELGKIRILNPKIDQHSKILQNSCQEFNQLMENFKLKSDDFISTMEKLGELIEFEKMKVIAGKHMLSQLAGQRTIAKQKLQILIAEEKMKMKKLIDDYESLVLCAAEQEKLLKNLIS